MKKLAWWSVVPCLLVASSALAAEPAPAAGGEKGGEREFGDQGVIAIGAETGLDFGYTNTTHPGSTPSSNDVHLHVEPSIQYFVIDSLSVGGNVEFDWVKPNEGPSQTTFGIGPTVGYNLWLSPGLFSVWPQATFTFNTTSVSITNNGNTTSGTINTTNVGVYVPLLIHPVKHFHFGVGPYFNVDLSSSESANGQSTDGDKNMNVGIKADISGWL